MATDQSLVRKAIKTPVYVFIDGKYQRRYFQPKEQNVIRVIKPMKGDVARLMKEQGITKIVS